MSEVDYETVLSWMVKAADNCTRSGRNDAALLWGDAKHYLDKQHTQIEQLQSENKRLRDVVIAAKNTITAYGEDWTDWAGLEQALKEINHEH